MRWPTETNAWAYRSFLQSAGVPTAHSGNEERTVKDLIRRMSTVRARNREQAH